MKTNIKTVGVKDLKDHLSAHLREVQAGWHILVTERNRVIAELHEPRDRAELEENPLRALWIREGKLRPARSHDKSKLPRSPIHAPEGTAQKLIDEDRGD